jgi:predicted O-methyltransferase YrrM
MILKNVLIYVREAVKSKKQYPEKLNIPVLVKYFYAWQRYIDLRSNALTDERPWITFEAIDFLNSILSDSMKVFEYGSGGSTIFFAKNVKEVISVEHDETWFQSVSASLKAKGLKNTDNLYLIAPEYEDVQSNLNPADPDSYVSDSSDFFGYTFRSYVKSIDRYEDDYFDLVLIDGRARPSCFKHAVSKVKKAGFIVLDNAERDYYKYAHTSLSTEKWKKVSFFGPGPYNRYFWETCAWQRLV